MRQVTITKAKQAVSVDFDSFTDTVKNYIVDYGLKQVLNDFISDMKTGEFRPDEYIAQVKVKIEQLANGETRAKRGGGFKTLEQFLVIEAKKALKNLLSRMTPEERAKHSEADLLKRLESHPKVKKAAQEAFDAQGRVTDIDLDDLM